MTAATLRKLTTPFVGLALAGPLGCKACRPTAARPAAPVGPARATGVVAPRPAPAPWVRKVVALPPLGKQVEVYQIVVTSKESVAPWVPERGRKRSLAQARELAERLVRRARAGEDFSALAAEFSDWPFAGRRGTPGYGGRLGLLTQGAPGLMEALAKVPFDLAIGQVSDPIQSPFGFHVLKRLPAARASEILLTYAGLGSAQAFDRTHAAARALAAQIEADLSAGKPFAAEAFDRSDDLSSAGRGGDIGAFDERSRVAPEVREVVSRLQVGQASAPLETPLGVLIVQRTE